MTSNEIKALYKDNIMQTYARFDVVIDHGQGARVYSPEGKEYIDFTSGIGVNSLGYGNVKWAEAIYQQALKLQHMSNLFYTEPGAALARELTARSGMAAVFYANSGAESNEGAIKLARKYSFDKYGQGRSKIVTLVQSFHGRTITTLAATGQDNFHTYFFPFTQGFAHARANDMESLKSVADSETCAVMLELVQGEGGVLPLAPEYVKQVEAFCKEKDLVFIVDEVQTGVGRTGALFAYQQYDVSPDVVTFAKGIAGGLPMGGILANEKCAGVLTAGTHAATFGGNPVTCAAALAVLSQLTPALIADVAGKGARIKKTITGWNSPRVKEVRGLGLMLGVSIQGAAPKEIAAKCIDSGLLMLTAGADAIRMLPPLTITDEEIDAGLAILEKVLEDAK
ncbi:acetylornithine/N-succinyldiaminopimelate aminotransferase [Sporobacter termitidis DSM 10068]|uniref:Acetylornithine aminotransferase n=1 Tax=Sporobacter termitidis DSM 10068 TaxID=1123282 RepID=A0A1M5Y1D4_9FIRM|nr:aspartate aminotransferase family protein [Sporobacter termitidis]SHI05880.1 acetylornithine/N-succinyldiaminopimelate aminotransferase [Sporobacter termitidis DSM 10068]